MSDKLSLIILLLLLARLTPPLPDLVWKSGSFVPGEVFCRADNSGGRSKSAETEAWLPLFLLSLLGEILPEESRCLSGFPREPAAPQRALCML